MNPNKPLTIGVIFPTLQAERFLPQCLTPWLNSPLKPRVLVIDSSSSDNTVVIAQKMGAETSVIPRRDFNHGLTREKARKYLDTDIIVMVTHDAYAVDENVLEKLIAPIVEGKAAASYARQIPHDGANFFEAFARNYNYPKNSQLRSIADVSKYGVYTFFCSDSCAAYDNRILGEIGGFPPVIFGEDTVVVAKMLHAGYSVAYVAEAMVKHSHSYSIAQEFSRSFDTGLARREFQHLIAIGGKDSVRGREYVKALLTEITQKQPYLLPYACVQILAKWLGYRIGSASTLAPIWLKKALSSQSYYWDSTYFLNNNKKKNNE